MRIARPIIAISLVACSSAPQRRSEKSPEQAKQTTQTVQASEATPTRPLHSDPFRSLGMSSAACPQGEKTDPAHIVILCNAKHEVVWIESTDGSAPELPASSKDIIHRNDPHTETALTVAADETHIWIERIECLACAKIRREVLVVWLPGLTQSQRNRLGERLHLVGASPLETSSDWIEALRKFSPAGFAELGEECPGQPKGVYLSCGKNNRISFAFEATPGKTATPLRAEPLLQKFVAGGIASVAVDGDDTWIEIRTPKADLLMAVQTDALTEKQAKTMRLVIGRRFNLRAKITPGMPQDADVWRRAFGMPASPSP